MKKIVVLLALASCALPAFAQQNMGEVRVRGSQIEVPDRPYRMPDLEFGNYIGGYDLSNGQSLVMTQIGYHMYAKISGGWPHEIVAAAPNVFVARDQSLKITLNRDEMDNYSGNVLIRTTNSTPLASTAEFISTDLVTSR